MKGRKKKPTQLKIIQGTDRADRRNPNEPMPDPNIPPPPPHLKDEALEEWNRLSTELYNLGLLSNIDRATLAAYCVLWARWVDAESKIDRDTLVLKSKDGQPYQNPWLGIANRALTLMRHYISEFGMSPASRSRVEAKPPKSKDEAAKFFTG